MMRDRWEEGCKRGGSKDAGEVGVGMQERWEEQVVETSGERWRGCAHQAPCRFCSSRSE